MSSPILLALLGCGDVATGIDGPPRIPDVFASKSDFDAALARIGTAEGSQFSGTYAATLSNVRFTTDCTVDFAREQDFFVDTGASDAELQLVLEQGYPDSPVTIQITHTGGRVTLDGTGDGVESVLTGSIDSDGTLQALTGTYASDRMFWGAVYNGSVTGSSLQATFESRITLLDDPVVPGSCGFLADVSGGR